MPPGASAPHAGLGTLAKPTEAPSTAADDILFACAARRERSVRRSGNTSQAYRGPFHRRRQERRPSWRNDTASGGGAPPAGQGVLQRGDAPRRGAPRRFSKMSNPRLSNIRKCRIWDCRESENVEPADGQMSNSRLSSFMKCRISDCRKAAFDSNQFLSKSSIVPHAFFDISCFYCRVVFRQ